MRIYLNVCTERMNWINTMKFWMMVSLLVCGCATPPLVTLNPQYKDATVFQDREFNILFISIDSIKINNKDDVDDDFPNDKRVSSMIIQDSLSRTIREEYENRLANIPCQFAILPQDSLRFQNNTDQFDLVKKSIRTKKDSLELKFLVPQKQRFRDLGFQPDIGLIITNLIVGRNFKYSYTGGQMYIPGPTISTPGGSFKAPGQWVGGGGGSSESLDANIQFIFWDYKQDCDIAYGRLTVSNSFFFGMTKHTWKEEFRLIANTILKETPLKKKKPKSNTSW